MIAEEEESVRMEEDVADNKEDLGKAVDDETSSINIPQKKTTFPSRDDSTVMTKVREDTTVSTAEDDDDDDRLWQVKKKSRTQRIMEKTQVEGQ